MMTTTTKFLAAVAALSVVVAGSGCAADGPKADECLRPDADGLGLVLAAHQGSPTGLSAFARCALGEALLRGTPVNVVSVEGVPQVMVRDAVLTGTYNSDRSHRAAVVKVGTEVADAVAATGPSSDGADLNAALRMVSDLTRAGGAQRPHVIANDSGLTDTGAIRMTQRGMLVADPDQLAAEVRAAGQCPVGEGTHVTFVGLGYGVAPQPLLTPADRDRVTALWSGIVAACGGTVDVRPDPASGTGPETAYTVELVQPTGYADPVLDDPITLAGESAFSFDHDRVDFKHSEQADEVLDGIVATLTAHPTWHLQIEGTTANGATAYPSLEALGLARAESVKNALVDRGIDAGRLVTRGHGYTADPPQVDAATSALNRKTVLTYFVP